MQTAVALMTILAAAFVGTECRSPPRPGPPQFDVCFSTINGCTRPLRENAFIAGESTDYRLLLEDVDGICESYQQYANCVQQNLHNCQDVDQHQAAVVFAIGGFLCSDEGKSLLAQYRESQCYNDTTILFQLGGFVRNCINELNVVVVPGQCQGIRDVYACVGNTVTWSCGEAAGRIFIGITNRLAPIFESQCNAQSVDDLAERGIGDFVRRQLGDFVRRKSGSGK